MMRGRFSADRMSQKPVRTLVVRLAMKRVATVFSIMFFKKEAKQEFHGEMKFPRPNAITVS